MSLQHPSRWSGPHTLPANRYWAEHLGLSLSMLAEEIACGAIDSPSPGRISTTSAIRYARRSGDYQLADHLGAVVRAMSSPAYFTD